jgi:predicted acetyltransferase
MIKLVKLSEEYKKQFNDMMEEWILSKEQIIPHALIGIDYHYFDVFVNNVERYEQLRVKVPVQLYFLLDTMNNKFIGSAILRPILNDDLLQRGGNIAYGIVPSYRNKGYGTKLLSLCLEILKEQGLEKVLVVCKKENTYSKKVITNNNGILENEIQLANYVIQRYFIKL